LLFTN